MAQKVQVLLVSDVDGSAATETVEFGLDGTEYEIDLNSKQAEGLRGGIVAECIRHGRKVSGKSRRGGRTRGPVLDTVAIRNWARENGYEVRDRGRVPADLVAKYQAATGR